MSESLRDQLLKSGLAQKLKAEAKPAPPQSSKKSQQKAQQNFKPVQATAVAARSTQELNLAHAYALRAKQEKDEQLRAQREAERLTQEKRERKQKLVALFNGKSLNAPDADTPRHFPHGNKIRRIYCTAEQLMRLNRGELAVAQLAGRYLLVERETALQAQVIDASAVVLLCDPNAAPEDDVPADLMW